MGPSLKVSSKSLSRQVRVYMATDPLAFFNMFIPPMDASIKLLSMNVTAA